jgi:RNA polymerase sigma-70 factor (ECF subfamily)
MNLDLAEQIEAHIPRLTRVAIRVTGRDTLAHDVVQEACIKALRKGHSFRGEAALTTWLHRIVANAAKDALRSRTRRQAAYDRYEQLGVRQSDTLPPDQQAQRKELGKLAWQHLDTLDPDSRAAFVLTQLDGYTYDEASDIEGVPRGTIATRTARAKRKLIEKFNTIQHKEMNHESQ